MVNLIYFICVLGYALAVNQPVCLGISFIGAFVYSVMLKGRDGIKTNLIYMLPLIVLTAVLNPAFSHQGVTILGYFPTGNPLTLESLVYGIVAAFTLVTVICWFSCFNQVMTSDKMVYLFGRIAPALQLVLSMTLRFVPDIAGQFKKVYTALKASGYSVPGKYFKRLRLGCHVMSIVVTWALERAVITADSMKARGYGLPGRKAYATFKFRFRDGVATGVLLIIFASLIYAKISGVFNFWYYPGISGDLLVGRQICFYITYVVLVFVPEILEAYSLWRVRRY
jgi:energy-coupling factor transport system permease protein